MNIQYKKLHTIKEENSKLGSYIKYESYRVNCYKEIGGPAEFSNILIEVKAMLDPYYKKQNSSKENSNNILLSNIKNEKSKSNVTYLSEEHLLNDFLNTVKELPEQIVSRVFCICDEIILHGNLTDNRKKDKSFSCENRIEISGKYITNKVFLLDAFLEFIMITEDGTIINAFKELVGEQSVLSINSSEYHNIAKELDATLRRSRVKVTNGFTSISQLKLIEDINDYWLNSKTPLNNINAKNAGRLPIIVFCILIVIRENADLLNMFYSNYNLQDLIKLTENLLDNLQYLSTRDTKNFNMSFFVEKYSINTRF